MDQDGKNDWDDGQTTAENNLEDEVNSNNPQQRRPAFSVPSSEAYENLKCCQHQAGSLG